MTAAVKRMPHIAALALAAVLSLVVVGLPASTTGAQLSASAPVKKVSSGVGNWCSVPNPGLKRNLYKLSEFPTVEVPDTASTRTSVKMLVIPVVNNSDFDPTGGENSVAGAQPGQLGVRLWSCTDPSALSSVSIKATAWRGSYDASNFVSQTLPSATNKFASARLNPSGGLTAGATQPGTVAGAELRDLHRGKNLQAAETTVDGVTARYSWILSNGRDKSMTNHKKAPACVTAGSRCVVTPTSGGDGAAGLAKAFSNNGSGPASPAVSENSVTFLAQKYYSSIKQVQCRSQSWFFGWGAFGAYQDVTGPSCPANTLTTRWDVPRTVDKTVVAGTRPAAMDTVLAPVASTDTVDSLLQDESGTKIQYVVLEWWGTVPTRDGKLMPDMEVEVFVN